MRLRSWLFGMTLAVAFSGRAAELPQAIWEQMDAAGIPRDALGIVVQRLSSGEVVLSHNADRSMQPASTLKLLTSLVALETLGPAYRGRTELRTRGNLAKGVLTGDLVLRGLGDVDFDWVALERMLQQLRSQGLRRIQGDFILDRTFFNPPRTDKGVPPFDEAPEFRYNVIPDALLLNTNLFSLDLASDGNRVQAAIATPLERVSAISRLKVVERACEDWEEGWITPGVVEARDGTIRIYLEGEFPRDCTASTAINVVDRVKFTDRLFRALWRRLGGTLRGTVRDGPSPPGTRLLAEHVSRPLADVVRDINKRSDNPVTRVVYLTMGALSPHSNASEPTATRAEREMRDWLTSRGIDPQGLVLENGSGLSRVERIRPAQLAAVLRAASASEWAPEFLAGLPIASIDGGMRRRLNGSTTAGRARLKTGTLRDVSAVAGYVRDAAQVSHVVVAIVNHENAKARMAQPILDSIVEWVAACSFNAARECAGNSP